MGLQLRNEGLAEGLAEGLLRCVKINVGQPNTETKTLILGIRDQHLIDACYDDIETKEIKTLEDLETKIQEC